MNNWISSVYSDGTEEFVSKPSPNLGDTVSVRLRVLDDSPVQHAFLRSIHNGSERVHEMRLKEVSQGLRYYEADLPMNQARVRYQFFLATSTMVYYYNQRGVFSYPPGNAWDFALLTDYIQPAWVKDAVFYQIFPDRFCDGDPDTDVQTGEYTMDGYPCTHMNWNDTPLEYPEGRCMDSFGGDLPGIRKKLPYLKELGVTALYLNPIFMAPTVHKYDCIDYFHVDPHFGGDQALADLTQAAHNLGMKVILDISINHTGTAHKWFNMGGDFFPTTMGAYHNPDSPERAFYFFQDGNQYTCWLGNKSLPTLNYTSDALRDIIYRGPDSVLRKWLRPPYSIDGWRFDVADVMAKNDTVQLSHTVWPEIRAAIRAENPQAYILAEDWADCADYLQGDEWDSPMNYFGCGRVIRQFLGKRDLFLERHPVLRDIPSPQTASDVESRVMTHLAQLPWVLRENQFNLFDSHDVSRLHNWPGITPEKYRGAVLFLFLLPGAPSIYYGDEAWVGGNEKNNEGCRWPMPWDSGFEHGAAYQLYHTMAHLRAQHPALRRGGMKFLAVGEHAFALARFNREEAFVAIVSNGTAPENLVLPFGDIGAIGPEGPVDLFGQPLTFSEDGSTLTVPPCGSYLISCRMKPC